MRKNQRKINDIRLRIPSHLFTEKEFEILLGNQWFLIDSTRSIDSSLIQIPPSVLNDVAYSNNSPFYVDIRSFLSNELSIEAIVEKYGNEFEKHWKEYLGLARAQSETLFIDWVNDYRAGSCFLTVAILDNFIVEIKGSIKVKPIDRLFGLEYSPEFDVQTIWSSVAANDFDD